VDGSVVVGDGKELLVPQEDVKHGDEGPYTGVSDLD